LTDAFTVSDEILLKDLMFVFQGIEGRIIRFHEESGEFRLDKEANVPRPIRDLVQRLCEIGFLYKKLSSHFGSMSAKDNVGLVAQSFCSSMQNELTQFYRLIAVLENAISRGEMTLRRLQLWCMEPTQRLRMMVAMVESCVGAYGGAQAGVVHSYIHHGDPTVQEFVHKVLKSMCSPLFIMVVRWVYEGDLVDPHAEFFIRSEFNVEEENWWKSKYILRTEMIPGFIDKALAKKIFLIGKSLNFLRFRAADQEWVAMRSQLGVKTAGIEYGDLQGFEKSIDSAFKLTSRRVISRLIDDYKLKEHLLAMKKYLLLGQGDFIQSLMDGLGCELIVTFFSIHNASIASILNKFNILYD
jgi:gamma-tubulin complex component 3